MRGVGYGKEPHVPPLVFGGFACGEPSSAHGGDCLIHSPIGGSVYSPPARRCSKGEQDCFLGGALRFLDFCIQQQYNENTDGTFEPVE